MLCNGGLPDFMECLGRTAARPIFNHFAALLLSNSTRQIPIPRPRRTHYILFRQRLQHILLVFICLHAFHTTATPERLDTTPIPVPIQLSFYESYLLSW